MARRILGAGRGTGTSGPVPVTFMISSMIAVASCFLTGCGAAEMHFLVAKGNYEYGRGDYQKANISYLRAGEHGEHSELLSYNLGNTYCALGEAEAALDEWAVPTESDDSEVAFRTHFNSGCLLYELGRYSDAYEAFRKALRINPGSRDAKINLEYALLKLQGAGEAPAIAVPDNEQQESGEASEESRRILEYVRRKELGLWESGSTAGRSEFADDW